MHICFLCNEYPPAPHGGIGSFTQTLGRALVRSGQRVTVVGAYPKQLATGENDEGVRVIRISRQGPPLIRFAMNRRRIADALRRVDRDDPIDILEGGELEICMADRSAPGVKVLRMHGGPRFFSSRPRPPLIKGWKERWAFYVADHLCAVSRCVADGTRRLMGLKGPIEVIPNAVDVKLFSPANSREEPGLVVFAGTVTQRKGIRELMKAVPWIVSEFPDARFEVYGGDDIFPENGVSLTKQLAESLPLHVRSRVAWKGRRPRAELPGALRRASVCVYPSHMEAMPLAWLEGMASGKAVVVSRTGPGPEVVDDGVTGLLCDPYDPASIAEKVLALLRDEALRRSLGHAARQIVVERYSLARIVERNLDYYVRIVGRRKET